MDRLPRRGFDHRLKSRRQNGTRGGSTEDYLSLFSAATAVFRADGGPSARNNCRGKTCVKSPEVAEVGTLETLMQILAERSAQQLI